MNQPIRRGRPPLRVRLLDGVAGGRADHFNYSEPMGPKDGDEKVVRGGSWRGQGEDCRSAVRIGENP